jgi:hypothetical protein
MCCENEKQMYEEKVVDFDAVSLYPSARNRLYVLERIPNVLNEEMLDVEFLMKNLFEDDQVEPSEERIIGGFFIKIEITDIRIERHFPLINNGDGYHNELCHMYVDHISLQDLIEFQKIIFNVLRGY